MPVEFSLGGNRGLGILAAGSPVVTTVACSVSAPLDMIETTVAASTSGLQYDATSGQYTYVWKTVKGSTGCRQLDVRLADGSSHVALFRFRWAHGLVPSPATMSRAEEFAVRLVPGGGTNRAAGSQSPGIGPL